MLERVDSASSTLVEWLSAKNLKTEKFAAKETGVCKISMGCAD